MFSNFALVSMHIYIDFCGLDAPSHFAILGLLVQMLRFVVFGLSGNEICDTKLAISNSLVSVSMVM